MLFSRSNIPTGSQSLKSALLRAWETWKKNIPQRSGERRDMAVRRLQSCFDASSSELRLSGLQLTSLPEVLPPHLKALLVDNNLLVTLPDDLPTGLHVLRVGTNRLTQLPSLPSGLQLLDVNKNRLKQLSSILPDSLVTLDVSGNQLIDLPIHLPTGLTTLNVSHNRLTHLPITLPPRLITLKANQNKLMTLPPTLPDRLQRLEVNHNQLVRLPEHLPDSLCCLCVDNNKLQRLPKTLPASLIVLNVINNQLTYLPHAFMPSLKTVTVAGNPLPNACYQKKENPKNPLSQILVDLPVSIEAWDHIARTKQGQSLARFLNHVLYHEKMIENRALVTALGNWLTFLAKEENRAVQIRFLQLAAEANSDAVDHMLYYLNQMHQLVMQASGGMS